MAHIALQQGGFRTAQNQAWMSFIATEMADEASLMRYFNELMWLPTAYLDDGDFTYIDLEITDIQYG